MTYKQALAASAQVRSGEHGTIVVFTKKLKVGDDEEERRISMLRTYTVFNVAQIDGLPQKEPVILTEVERIPVAGRRDRSGDSTALCLYSRRGPVFSWNSSQRFAKVLG
jgi:antirestriction protein ArdC